MRKFAVPLMLFLLLVPLVSGATLNCSDKVHGNEVICHLEGSGKGRLYLRSVDGVSSGGYTIIITDATGRERISSSQEQETFVLPANITFYPENILNDVIDGYLTFQPYWVVLNKWHSFVFEFQENDGISGTFKVELYLEGKPEWGEVKEDFMASLLASLVVGLVVLAGFGLICLLKNRGPGLRGTMFALAFGVFSLFFTLNFLGPALFTFLYYNFGSGTGLWGDVMFGWGIWVLSVMLSVYLTVYLLITPELEALAYSKPLKALKNQKLGLCSGLGWIPFMMVAYLQINSTPLIIGLVAVSVVLGMFSQDIPERIKPEGVLFINLTLVGVLWFALRPDLPFLGILVILFMLVYSIQRKCLSKFALEKERLVREVENRVKMIGG